MAKMKKVMKKRRPRIRKQPAKYNIPEDVKIDYKNLPFIQRFSTDRGKILSRRITGANAKQQRLITEAIKRARYLGLLSVGGSQK